MVATYTARVEGHGTVARVLLHALRHYALWYWQILIWQFHLDHQTAKFNFRLNFLAIWYLLLADIRRETPHVVWPPPQWRPVWSPHSWSYPGVQSHQWHVLPSWSAAEYIHGDVTCWHCKPRPGKVSKFCTISPLGVCSEAWWCSLYACILVAWSAVLSWPQGKKKPGSELLVSVWTS